MKLWGGRFSENLNTLAARMNSSLGFDQRLAKMDIQGSKAWAKALAGAGIVNEEELAHLLQGLEKINGEFEESKFVYHESDEDIHTAVERRLKEIAGPVAGKLHTGRSRNDQVATDFRLWVLDAIPRLDELVKTLQWTLVERAEGDIGTILPGYTHMQQAQPVLLSHWWLWHFWMLQRDRDRLLDLAEETAVLPLGCGALAGSSFPIDRFALASELGFRRPFPNSLDAVSDRDFAAALLFWASLLGVHLSRLSEALILYSSREFAFIRLSDAFSTGSSLMPQKKNPDLLELTRAQSGKLIGLLAGLLAVLKGLPSAYDKDLQEDKLAVFEAVDRLTDSLPVMSGLLASLEVNQSRMREALDANMMATDLADYLVRKGIPFREAHEAVGRGVQKAEELRILLSEMPVEDWREIHPAFESDMVEEFSPEKSVEHRSAFGGTSPQAVLEQLALARQVLG
ncbi:MAG: argininosuccinate lyase [Anaerolineaceae bacterium]|nr:argininosuccinate lyase [Anaerolineaceae bacterium]